MHDCDRRFREVRTVHSEECRCLLGPQTLPHAPDSFAEIAGPLPDHFECGPMTQARQCLLKFKLSPIRRRGHDNTLEESAEPSDGTLQHCHGNCRTGLVAESTALRDRQACLGLPRHRHAGHDHRDLSRTSVLKGSLSLNSRLILGLLHVASFPIKHT